MLNFIIIQGNLVSDPELSKTKKKGTSVVNTRIACKRDVRGTGRDADFIRVSFWGDQAEYVFKTFKKGDNITVEGRLEEVLHTTKENQTFSFMEVRAQNVHSGITKGMRNLIHDTQTGNMEKVENVNTNTAEKGDS